MINEFKKFILRGNVMDLAVGVIIGGAFQSIIKSFVKDLINPLLGLFVKGDSFSSFTFKLGSSSFLIGDFINDVINFLILGLVLFLMIKLMNRFSAFQKDDAETEIAVLKDIRTQLVKNNKSSKL